MLAELNDLKRKFATYKSRAEMIGIILVALFLVVFGVGWYIHNSIVAGKDREIDAWDLKAQMLTKKVQADSSIKYEQEVLIGEERDLKQHALDDATNYKNLYFSLKAKVGAVATNISVPIKADTLRLKPIVIPAGCDSLVAALYNECDSLLSLCVPYGSSFSTTQKWIIADGTIQPNELRFDRFGFTSGDISLVLGKEKATWFKNKKLYESGKTTTTLHIENPHFVITDMSSIKVKDKRKPKRLAWLLSGVAIGVAGGILLIAN